ncbi:MAG: hypothetical protein PHU51_01525 [Candidatus Nanoarchaeia archaeon]|nr:hypothetical protein [Candidatus Nanoarchaeia archaeon]
MVNESIEEQIRKDLLKSGFPLELNVASILEDKGWNVLQNEYISEGDHEYEIDIIAFKIFEAEYENITFKLRTRFIIECKKSEKHPWVFFMREKQEFDTSYKLLKRISNFGINRPFRLKSNGSSEDINFLKNEIGYDDLNVFKWNNKSTSYCQAFRDPNKENQIYFAIKSLLRNLKIIQNKLNKSLYDGQWTEIFLNIDFPVIVLDGNLFECFLKKGDLKINSSSEIPFITNYGETNQEKILINILKINQLENFIEKVEQDSQKLFDKYLKVKYVDSHKLRM